MHVIGCWRDPQPFVAMTARRLVSTLAVLYYTLVEDVLSIAETAGLVWKPQDGDSESKGPWTWEGESSKVGYLLHVGLHARHQE